MESLPFTHRFWRTLVVALIIIGPLFALAQSRLTSAQSELFVRYVATDEGPRGTILVVLGSGASTMPDNALDLFIDGEPFGVIDSISSEGAFSFAAGDLPHLAIGEHTLLLVDPAADATAEVTFETTLPKKAIPIKFHVVPGLKTKADWETEFDAWITYCNGLFTDAKINFKKVTIKEDTPANASRDVIDTKADQDIIDEPNAYHIYIQDIGIGMDAGTLPNYRTRIGKSGWTDNPAKDDTKEDPPRKVFCHEMGHALGLPGTSTRKATFPDLSQEEYDKKVAEAGEVDNLMRDEHPGGEKLTENQRNVARAGKLAGRFESTAEDSSDDSIEDAYVSLSEVVVSTWSDALFGTLLLGGPIPDAPAAPVTYALAINTDNDLITGANETEGPSQGAEVVGQLRIDADGTIDAEIMLWDTESQDFATLQSMDFEIFPEPGSVVMIIPDDVLQMVLPDEQGDEPAVVSWRAFTAREGSEIQDQAPDADFKLLDSVFIPWGESSTSLEAGRPLPETDEQFRLRWGRTETPLIEGLVSRTFIWGPDVYIGTFLETYDNGPDGARMVHYFEKSRMELTCPVEVCTTLDPGSIWYVTNGLLVVELISGQLQTGDNRFEDREAAAINVTGDPGDETGLSPTYADIDRYNLRAQPALAEGSVITQRIDANGQISDDPSKLAENVLAAPSVQVPGINHTIAAPFWVFMTSEGLVLEDGAYVVEALFDNPFYATGYPITEAFWSRVLVGGTERDVLWQCFERRCLTYTPGNPVGFIVETGNVGQHYYRWRYE